MPGRSYLAVLAACLSLLILIPDIGAENRALLVGVGPYNDPHINDLPGIEKDLEMMRKVVLMAGLTDRQIKELKDSSATLANIEKTIESWLISGVNSGDRVIFYFSGHGSQVPDLDGDEKDDNADEVLVPYDAVVGPGKLSNVFLDDSFGKLIARIPAKEILVFVDACHSGTSTKSFGLVPKFLSYPGIPTSVKSSFAVEPTTGAGSGGQKKDMYVALSASRDDESAMATGEGSLFTRGVLDAVEAAFREDRSLTMDVLRIKATDYIRRNVSDPSKQHTPQITGNISLAKSIELLRKPETESLWTRLETLVASAPDSVQIRTNKSYYQHGDNLVVSCDVPRTGYLNILEVSPGDTQATILYPNSFHPENWVKGGTRITIPGDGDKFRLKAIKRGESMIVVFLTDQRLNAYEEGEGKVADVFKQISPKGARSAFGVTRVESETEGRYFGAGKFVTVVK